MAREILDVKENLRELSRQLIRIERLMQAALPREDRLPKPKSLRKMEEQAARRLIDRLTEEAVGGTPIEAELRRMTVKNELAVLARTLGLTNRKLPPKDQLVSLVATRLRQSALVTRGFREAAGETSAHPG